MAFDVNEIFSRASVVMALIPDIIALYSDIVKDGELTDASSLGRIVQFIDSKNAGLAAYASPGEVTMLVCGILGVLHKGDSSQLYLKVVAGVAGPASA